MTMTAGDFAAFLAKDVPKVISSNLDKRLKEMEMNRYFTKSSVNTEWVDSRQLEAMGPARMIVEGAPMPKLEMKMGHPKRKSWIEYGARLEITKRLRKLQKIDLVGRGIKELVNSPRQLIETLGAYIFRYGNQTLANVPTQNNVPVVDTICGDGLPIFHTAHTFASEGPYTFANLLSPYRSLSQSSLQDATITVQQWRNNVDDLLEADVEQVIVGSPNKYKIAELLKSEHKSETANRATNALREDYSANAFSVWKRLGNTYDWYLKTTWENDFEYLVAWEPEQESDYDKNLRVYRYFLDFAIGFGVNDPRKYLAVKQ